jgi:hypothetical protein
MDLIWSIVGVFGFVSMLMLILGLWTHLDMRKKQQKESENPKAENSAKK